MHWLGRVLLVCLFLASVNARLLYSHASAQEQQTLRGLQQLFRFNSPPPPPAASPPPPPPPWSMPPPSPILSPPPPPFVQEFPPPPDSPPPPKEEIVKGKAQIVPLHDAQPPPGPMTRENRVAASDLGMTDSQSNAVIAGSVIGAIIGAGVLICVLMLFLRRGNTAPIPSTASWQDRIRSGVAPQTVPSFKKSMNRGRVADRDTIEIGVDSEHKPKRSKKHGSKKKVAPSADKESKSAKESKGEKRSDSHTKDTAKHDDKGHKSLKVKAGGPPDGLTKVVSSTPLKGTPKVNDKAVGEAKGFATTPKNGNTPKSGADSKAFVTTPKKSSAADKHFFAPKDPSKDHSDQDTVFIKQDNRKGHVLKVEAALQHTAAKPIRADSPARSRSRKEADVESSVTSPLSPAALDAVRAADRSKSVNRRDSSVERERALPKSVEPEPTKTKSSDRRAGSSDRHHTPQKPRSKEPTSAEESSSASKTAEKRQGTDRRPSSAERRNSNVEGPRIVEGHRGPSRERVRVPSVERERQRQVSVERHGASSRDQQSARSTERYRAPSRDRQRAPSTERGRTDRTERTERIERTEHTSSVERARGAGHTSRSRTKARGDESAREQSANESGAGTERGARRGSSDKYGRSPSARREGRHSRFTSPKRGDAEREQSLTADIKHVLSPRV